MRLTLVYFLVWWGMKERLCEVFSVIRQRTTGLEGTVFRFGPARGSCDGDIKEDKWGPPAVSGASALCAGTRVERINYPMQALHI